MLLWYVVTAAVGVWAVFDSPALDYRVVMLGAALPVAEIALGRPGPLHSLVTAVAVLCAVMLLTRNRRLVRRRWLGIPIGLLAYLVFSGTWADTDAFWWPLTGTALSDAEPPELARLGVSLVLEGLAVALLGWWWCRRVGLDVAANRAAFVRTGRLPPIDLTPGGRLVLTVVRHGRTAANKERRLLGRLDVALDDHGLAQARAVADQVGPVDRLISSPLERTRQTAAAWGQPVEIDDRWVELDYGELDGTPLADVDPQTWARWRRDTSFAPAGGESVADLGVRVRAACEDLRARARDEHVLVVTHVSPIKAAVAWAVAGTDDLAWRLFVAPASITRIGVGDDRVALHEFNVTTHLDEIGS